MSKDLQLEHISDIIANTKESVKLFLFTTANYDSDFNGDNGYEYLWEDAEGFETNAEYCWSIAEKQPTPRAMIETFIGLWMGKDNYYLDYDLEILQHEEILFVSLAFTTEW
jgi:hypothetical protein